ncbi:MAG: hypothetical protein V3S01_06165, partial [Dehalococcoidia bacterium]
KEIGPLDGKGTPVATGAARSGEVFYLDVSVGGPRLEERFVLGHPGVRRLWRPPTARTSTAVVGFRATAPRGAGRRPEAAGMRDP